MRLVCCVAQVWHWCGVAVLPVSQSAAAGTRLASRVRSRESNEYSHVRRNRKSAPKMLDGREIRIASIASRFASSVDPEARRVHDRYMRCIDIDILFTLISIHLNLKYSDFRSFVCEAEGEGRPPHSSTLHTPHMLSYTPGTCATNTAASKLNDSFSQESRLQGHGTS